MCQNGFGMDHDIFEHNNKGDVFGGSFGLSITPIELLLFSLISPLGHPPRHRSGSARLTKIDAGLCSKRGANATVFYQRNWTRSTYTASRSSRSLLIHSDSNAIPTFARCTGS